jgi:hypothetical protein
MLFEKVAKSVAMCFIKMTRFTTVFFVEKVEKCDFEKCQSKRARKLAQCGHPAQSYDFDLQRQRCKNLQRN